MTRTWTIELPYASPPLSLNDRMHWARANWWKQCIRADAHTLALAERLPLGLTRVEIALHYQPSTKRSRDEDNMFATLKPAIDGLVQYGLVADDDSAHVTSRCVIEPVAKPARLWLTITDLSEATHA